MKHFKQLTLIILTRSLLLCGCGGASTNGTDENTENNSNNNNTNNESIAEKKEYTFNEYISSGETIWFLTDGYGKDAKIKNIFVLDKNGSLYYCFNPHSIDSYYDLDWTLGKAEQMDDKEIISYVKQTYTKLVSEEIDYMSSLQGKEFDLSIIVSDTAPIYSEYKDNIKPAQYKLGIISDSTGNKTENEFLCIQDFAPLTIDRPYFSAKIANIELSYLAPYESDMGATNCFQVYDSWYGGFAVKTISYQNTEQSWPDRRDYYFLTRTTTNKIFNFDEVGTKNIGIDNIDSLFDAISVEVEFKAQTEE